MRSRILFARLNCWRQFRAFRVCWAATMLFFGLVVGGGDAFADEPPAMLDFGVEYLGDEWWVIYGSLEDEQADFCSVYFGGVLDGYFVDVGADGEFALVIELPPGNFGAVSAVALDGLTQWSNVVWDYLPNY